MRRRYGLAILGYVVMPEHVHLLVSEPTRGTLDRAIQALKISVSRRRTERPFWQRRYYDFNVHSAEKTSEKLRYIHRNPVARGLVARPEDWPWSSYRHYATGCSGAVEIESFWTAWEREHEETLQTTEHRSVEIRVLHVSKSGNAARPFSSTAITQHENGIES
jgi:putative transposase